MKKSTLTFTVAIGLLVCSLVFSGCNNNETNKHSAYNQLVKKAKTDSLNRKTTYKAKAELEKKQRDSIHRAESLRKVSETNKKLSAKKKIDDMIEELNVQTNILFKLAPEGKYGTSKWNSANSRCETLSDKLESMRGKMTSGQIKRFDSVYGGYMEVLIGATEGAQDI